RVDGVLGLGAGQRRLLDEHAPMREAEHASAEDRDGPQLEDRAPPEHAKPPEPLQEPRDPPALTPSPRSATHGPGSAPRTSTTPGPGTGHRTAPVRKTGTTRGIDAA